MDFLMFYIMPMKNRASIEKTDFAVEPARAQDCKHSLSLLESAIATCLFDS